MKWALRCISLNLQQHHCGSAAMLHSTAQHKAVAIALLQCCRNCFNDEVQEVGHGAQDSMPHSIPDQALPKLQYVLQELLHVKSLRGSINNTHQIWQAFMICRRTVPDDLISEAAQHGNAQLIWHSTAQLTRHSTAQPSTAQHSYVQTPRSDLNSRKCCRNCLRLRV